MRKLQKNRSTGVVVAFTLFNFSMVEKAHCFGFVFSSLIPADSFTQAYLVCVRSGCDAVILKCSAVNKEKKKREKKREKNKTRAG